MKKNAIYAQSGGVSAVINASACGVITASREENLYINNLFAAKNGILGVLNEELIDTGFESENNIQALRYTPGGAFGSCRYKLSLANNSKEYKRLLEVFSAHDIGYFFYNGGNDSADTCLKVAQIASEMGYPMQAIHIPKTIDNDLVITDNCPGFGSVAKYIATSIMEAGLDLASMCATSTKVFIMEVMGRNAGWIAASSGMAAQDLAEPPHIILFPEIVFDQDKFLLEVQCKVKQFGYCVVVTSEGVKYANGQFLADLNEGNSKLDAFGHKHLGGAASKLSNLVNNQLKIKCRFAIPDYLQRSARHLASTTDIKQAYALGYQGVKLAISGHNSIMPCIKRIANNPYTWKIDYANLADIANQEKFMPRDFISNDGFHITQACREYIQPLIDGEDYPPFVNGLPQYVILKKQMVVKKLDNWEI